MLNKKHDLRPTKMPFILTWSKSLKYCSIPFSFRLVQYLLKLFLMIHFFPSSLVIPCSVFCLFCFFILHMFGVFRFWSSSSLLALITVEISNKFPNGRGATFKLNLTRCLPYFAFDQFPWASHVIKGFGSRDGEYTLYVHDSFSCSVFQFITTREYWWGDIPPLLLLNDVLYFFNW